jgi:hypothetical protein
MITRQSLIWVIWGQKKVTQLKCRKTLSLKATVQSECPGNWTERLFRWFLAQVWILFILGIKLGRTAKMKNLVYFLQATVLILVIYVVLVISRSSLNITHLGLKTRSKGSSMGKTLPSLNMQLNVYLHVCTTLEATSLKLVINGWSCSNSYYFRCR